jgi:hypothetical protein
MRTGNSPAIRALFPMGILLCCNGLSVRPLNTALVPTAVIKLLAYGDFYTEMKLPCEDMGEY